MFFRIVFSIVYFLDAAFLELILNLYNLKTENNESIVVETLGL